MLARKYSVLIDGLLIELLHHLQISASCKVEHQLVVGEICWCYTHRLHSSKCLKSFICSTWLGCEHLHIESKIAFRILSLIEECLKSCVHMFHEPIWLPLGVIRWFSFRIWHFLHSIELFYML